MLTTMFPNPKARDTEDARITRLESQLAELYKKRRGRWVVATWFWCFECGAVKTTVEPDPATAGDHCRTGRCCGCQERHCRDVQAAIWVARASSEIVTEEERADASRTVMLGENAPAPGVDVAIAAMRRDPTMFRFGVSR